MGPTEQTTRPIRWTILIESFLPSYYSICLYPIILVAIPTLPPATSTAVPSPPSASSPSWSWYIFAPSAGRYTCAHADAPAPTQLEGGTGSTPTTTETPTLLVLTLRTLVDFVLNLAVVATYTLSRGVLSFESPALANGAAAGAFVLHGLAVLGVSFIGARTLSVSTSGVEKPRHEVLDAGLGEAPLSKEEKEYMGEIPSL
ncbi:hypothetical protein FB45DRAFT_1036359 [Roridomyces roridus]|uniref:Uncharacterized protein n=1 Tax=Roridomyces roridus TaxID=1738132 RepID=A0AAD7B8J6_9AGAR|nr:hypothetical protein FB45DRAFT_1036359 [Roridomyces roridus]